MDLASVAYARRSDGGAGTYQAQRGGHARPDHPLVVADTAVWLDGDPLGKPTDTDDADAEEALRLRS